MLQLFVTDWIRRNDGIVFGWQLKTDHIFQPGKTATFFHPNFPKYLNRTEPLCSAASGVGSYTVQLESHNVTKILK